MAPKAATAICHDPQKADVWSLAIIYCCIVLVRFPWKSPDGSSEAFALFAAMESLTTALALPNPPSRATSTNSVTQANVTIIDDDEDKQKVAEKVLGPWGLLRQLPCQSRDVIKAMLTIDPDRGPNLQLVMKMEWVATAQHCTENVDGKFRPVAGHQRSD